MREYYHFDAEQFLKESRHWSKELKDLRAELESITEIGGVPDSPGGSSDISRPVERTAIDRERIMAKIDKIHEKQEAFLYAWRRVSPDEQELIAGFFVTDTPLYKFVDAWCVKHTSNRQYCYRDRRLAIASFQKQIERWMEANGYDV